MRQTSRWIRVASLTCATLVCGPVLLSACAKPVPGGSPVGGPAPAASTTAPDTTPPATLTPAPTGTSGPGTAPPPMSGTTVQVARTGGIAGVSQMVQITPSGSWVFQDRKAGTSRHGTLTAAQMTQFRRLLSDPDLIREARTSPPPVTCNDGFTWVVTIGELIVRVEDCGGGNHPAIDAVLRFVTDVTAM